MKKFGFCSILALSMFSLSTSVSPLRAYADSIVTLQLEGVGPGNNADGYYTYPYEFSVNGSSTLVAMMCVSFNNEITFGESWQATVEPITGTVDKEAAWLFNDAVNAPNSTQSNEDQLAAWYLLSGNGNPADGNNAQLADAIAFVAGNPNDTSLYSDLAIYVPIDGTQSWGGTPQTFIADPPQTPEPSSLLLLGSGLLASARVMYRRRRIA